MDKKYLMLFLTVLALALGIFALASGLFDVNRFSFHLLSEPARYAMLFAIAVLLALNITVLAYSKNNRKNKKTVAAGVAAGLAASLCPVCQPFLIVWIEAGSLVGLLSFLSPLLGILSVALLLFSLNLSLSTSAAKCEVK